MDKSEKSGMATHGMHNTTLSKPLVVHRVACVWSVHHQEDGKSDVLDEGVEHNNGVVEVSGCHQTMVCWSSLCGHPVSAPFNHAWAPWWAWIGVVWCARPVVCVCCG